MPPALAKTSFRGAPETMAAEGHDKCERNGAGVVRQTRDAHRDHVVWPLLTGGKTTDSDAVRESDTNPGLKREIGDCLDFAQHNKKSSADKTISCC